MKFILGENMVYHLDDLYLLSGKSPGAGEAGLSAVVNNPLDDIRAVLASTRDSKDAPVLDLLNRLYTLDDVEDAFKAGRSTLYNQNDTFKQYMIQKHEKIQEIEIESSYGYHGEGGQMVIDDLHLNQDLNNKVIIEPNSIKYTTREVSYDLYKEYSKARMKNKAPLI